MIDLRSDTLTLPSKEMLETILNAKLGDEGRTNAEGRGEDITTNELEDMAAAITGKEAALFFPSGTSANSCAVLSFCKRGDIILTDRRQHMLLSEKICFYDEGFGMKQLSYENDKESNIPIASSIDRLTDENDVKLVCLENTHNFSGGKVIPTEAMATIHSICEKKNIPVHLDGARLFNAALFLGVKASDICRYTDSVMFCLSKGLGAPIGSLLCGNRAFISKARENRKLIGACMRQSGVAAACGIYALEHNIDDLKTDHENAMLCARLFNERQTAGLLKVDSKPQSNIILINFEETGLNSNMILNKFKEFGLLASKVSDTEIRLVFHRGNTKNEAILAANMLINTELSIAEK